MKLLHWFPLNNTFEDKGANNNTELQIYKNKPINFTTVGKLGLSPTFTGAPDEALLIDNKINKTNINISLWFKINNLTNIHTLLCSRNAVYQGLLILIYQNRFIFDCLTDKNLRWVPNYIPRPNEWTHLSINFENNRVSYFINGIFQEQKDINMTTSGLSNKLMIGQISGSIDTPSNNSILNGSIQDIRIYDEPLSVKQIRDLAKAEVINNNFKELQSDDETNVYGELAGFFNENTTELKDKNIQLTINNHSFTNSFWIKLTDRTLKIFNKSVDIFNIGKKLNLSLRLNKLGDIIYGTHDEYITSNKALEPKKWYLITTKYDRDYNTIYLYINGELQHSLRLTKLLQVDDYILTLGHKELECYLSRFKLNAKLFSDEEIQEEYTNVASVDNKNNIEASEFIEYQDNRIVTTPKSDVVYLKNLAKDRPPINTIRLYAANNYKEYKGYNKFDIRTLKPETKNGMVLKTEYEYQTLRLDNGTTEDTVFLIEPGHPIEITPNKTRMVLFNVRNTYPSWGLQDSKFFIKPTETKDDIELIIKEFAITNGDYIEAISKSNQTYSTDLIGIELRKNAIFWGTIFKLMITDTSNTEWEPFTNNKPAPRLNWEIPVQAFGEIEHFRLSINQTQNLVTPNTNKLEILTNSYKLNLINNGQEINRINVKKGKTYKIYFKKLKESSSDYKSSVSGYLNESPFPSCGFYNFHNLTLNQVYSKEFTPSVDGYLTNRIYTEPPKDVTIEYQLWVNESSLETEFKMPIINKKDARLIGIGLDLQSIGEVKDYIYYNQLDKKWYVKKFIKKYQLTGNEDWQIETDSGINDNRRITFRNNSYIKDSSYFEDNQTVISNRLINRNEYDEIIEDQIRIVNENGKGEIITTLKNTIANVNELKTFLKSNPTYIYYIQKEPKDIEITNTNLLSDLNSLWLNLSTLQEDTRLEISPNWDYYIERIKKPIALQVEYNQQNDNTNAKQKIIETSQILANEFIETENTAKISSDNKYIIANEIIEY